MGWKIYFWIQLLLTIIGFLALSGKLQGSNLVDWVSLLISLAFVVSSFAFAFHKMLISSQVWKILFWFSVVYWVLATIQTFVPSSLLGFMSGKIQSSTTEVLIGLVMSIPAFYATYKLGNNEFATK